MRAKPFGVGKRDPGWRNAGKTASITFDHRGSFHKVHHAKPGRKSRRARGRQYMVGSGDIVADGFRCVATKEDRAGMSDLGKPAARLRHREFKMLGGDPVGERGHVPHRINRDDGPVILP